MTTGSYYLTARTRADADSDVCLFGPKAMLDEYVEYISAETGNGAAGMTSDVYVACNRLRGAVRVVHGFSDEVGKPDHYLVDVGAASGAGGE
ncbi:hypothetical protein EUX98_g7462 [Antrodiella citrinella]|uniref:Uncharacterized protein n=1 Tax=Antrodiella citrinella TaxID=2447956 RepID=A0A4S4MNV7_9APHY|nr:hypothetical protein EUX98_g7462 [Antrodiella citrinella]